MIKIYRKIDINEEIEFDLKDSSKKKLIIEKII